jgi:hypothetical protein
LPSSEWQCLSQSVNKQDNSSDQFIICIICITFFFQFLGPTRPTSESSKATCDMSTSSSSADPDQQSTVVNAESQSARDVSSAPISLPPSSLTPASKHVDSVPHHPHPQHIPVQLLKGRTLSFRQSWFDSYPWLHYQASLSGVLCFFCEKAERLGLFQLSRNREDAFITTGFRNWKKALQRFQEHAQSRSHQFAVERVAHHQAAQPVECQLSTQRDAEQREARCCLKVIFTSIQYLARQGLALRGHTDSEGNFKQLLLLRCRDKPVMQRWLDRRTNMTSPRRHRMRSCS